MKIVYIIQAVCAVVIVTFLTIAIIYAKKVKGIAAQQSGNNTEEFYKSLEINRTRENLLANQMMSQAKELIEAGDYRMANDKLRFLINFYSSDKNAIEAYEILGAINLDQLFSPANPQYKTNYTIKRGDSLSRIAKQNESTIENIMELNGLLYNNRIHPGQKIVVMSLNFKTVINVEKKTLTLLDGETFIKQYPLLEVLYSSSSKKVDTEIGRTMAIDGEKLISRISSRYATNRKVNILKGSDIQIRPVKHPDEPDLGRGFFLSEADMEEYNLFVRAGSVVEIQN